MVGAGSLVSARDLLAATVTGSAPAAKPQTQNCLPIFRVLFEPYPPEMPRGKRGYWLEVWQLYDCDTQQQVDWIWGAKTLNPN